MDTKKIVVVGSCNTDMVIKADRLPIPGETILGGTFFMNPGGKGANQAVAASRMGGKVTLISKTGNDVFGKQSVMLYNSENINTDFVFSDPGHPSGVALITVDSNGENCIVVASGANAFLTPSDINKAIKEIESSDLVLMQLEIPIDTVEYVAEIANKKGIKVILNPAPARALSDKLYYPQ
jgi:ribokinase